MRMAVREAEFRSPRAAAVLLLANLLDGLFTLTFLQMRLIDEANPLMRWAYEGSPLTFMTAKLAIVQLALMLLWGRRSAPCAAMAIRGGAALYATIVAYHVAILAAFTA